MITCKRIQVDKKYCLKDCELDFLGSFLFPYIAMLLGRRVNNNEAFYNRSLILTICRTIVMRTASMSKSNHSFLLLALLLYCYKIGAHAIVQLVTIHG